MPKKKEDRCWEGYEPVPGKSQHEQGSCRKKAPSKSTGAEKKAQAARAAQLTKWQKDHPGSSKAAAQHLHKPKAKSKTAASSTA
jgi:hypothetical protein